jgi:uncharacterized protein (TIGR02301 family)
MRALLLFYVLLTLLLQVGANTAHASKPYDRELLRVAEILGAVHYLRELCGADEGQRWRSWMQSLLDSEGATAARRVSMVRSFNDSYRNYRRTYKRCTQSAKTAADRFLQEGARITDKIARENN